MNGWLAYGRQRPRERKVRKAPAHVEAQAAVAAREQVEARAADFKGRAARRKPGPETPVTSSATQLAMTLS